MTNRNPPADKTKLPDDLEENPGIGQSKGIFARAGLASDVEVVEEFPARYDVASMRQHRWVRGDWQLLPWIFGRADAGAETHGRGRGRTPLIGVWKMLDNLRRSLSAPMTVAALVTGWMLPWPAALQWCAIIVLALGLPTMLPAFAGILPRRSTVTLILGRLHESGIVSTTRGLVRVNDQSALEERSCGCHRLVMDLIGQVPSPEAHTVGESWQETVR